MIYTMEVLDYKYYSKPKPFLAVACDDDCVWEVSLSDFIEYLFGIDPNLEQYYIDHHRRYSDLFKDIEDIGVDIVERLTLFLNDHNIAQYLLPIPKGLYPRVLRHYRGEATNIDKLMLTEFFKMMGMPPPHPDFDTGV
jgi:hypothetical protein